VFSLHSNMGNGIYGLNSKSGCTVHMPVMVSEVLKAFESTPEGWLIDGTFGLGGHSSALLERYPDRRFLVLILMLILLQCPREDFKNLIIEFS